MSLWQKIKEMVNKLLPKKTIEEVFHVAPAVSDRMSDAIQLWSDMYEGNSPWCREPSYEDPTRIVSLGLPALIASEKARMVTLEMKSEVSAPEADTATPDMSDSAPGEATPNVGNAPKNESEDDTSTRAGFLNKHYKKVLKQIRRQLEYGIAKGGLVIKPYIVLYDDQESGNESSNSLYYKQKLDKADIEFDYIQADRFFPLSFDANGKVLEAAFVQTKVDKAKERVFIRLEHHKLEGHRVIVQNMAFESTDMSLANTSNIKSASHLGTPIPLKSVAEWASLQPRTVIENVDTLLFAYFKMPEANTVDPYSPLGVSGYSRVVQLIKDADMQYSRLLWEFEAGEMAIDVDRDALKFITDPASAGGEGYSILPQKQQRLFRKVDLNAEDTYEVFAPALRDTSITNGLNTIFMRIEDATGLSRGTLSDITSVEIRTATELKIMKQRSYATNADIQHALQDTLENLVKIMDIYCDLYDAAPDGEYNVSFEWDDSILVDSESELSKRLTLMQNGIASKLETRMWYFGETEAQAWAALQIVSRESMETAQQNAQAQRMMSAAGNENTTGQQVKASGDTTSAKKSTAQQANSLENPTKGKTLTISDAE